MLFNINTSLEPYNFLYKRETPKGACVSHIHSHASFDSTISIHVVAGSRGGGGGTDDRQYQRLRMCEVCACVTKCRIHVKS